MKTCILSITAAFAALGQASAEPPAPSEIHRHVVDVLQSIHDQFPEPLKKFTETFPPISIPREGMIMLAQAGTSAAPGADPFVDPAAIADWANNLAAVTTRATLDGIFPRSTPRKPVIVGAVGNAKANAAMEEDLNVMMRILEKAAGGKEERPTAGGIELFSFGKATSPRVFYIDGYGAMFVLNVKYPLLAPPTKDDSRTNEPTNTEWEKAREEVYGRGRGSEDVRFNFAPGEEFDTEKVERLKGQLIEELLNAKNIRNLKSDDYVTVVVLGGGPRGGVMRREIRTPAGGRGGGGGGGVGGRAGTQGGGSSASAGIEVGELRTSGPDSGAQSTMTLRVKKSDVDKFAKEKQAAEQGGSDKLTSEIVGEFAKKVSVQTY
ncbi:MAG TPA: hypothetical protein VNT99_10715 [Methylomirabilota bacterium]|nr:hypothetical protein [Methylomirabilota bacterium]